MFPVSTSSSAISEKIAAIANNQRLLVTKHGLAIAVVASLDGGLIISEDQAAVINSALAVAMYTFRHSDPSRITVEGHELVARTLGVRISLTELRGTRSNIGAPAEMVFGDSNAPVIKIIQYDGKAKAPSEFFSYVGSSFMNNLMTQDNLNYLLSVFAGPNLQVKFAKAFQPLATSIEVDDEEVIEDNNSSNNNQINTVSSNNNNNIMNSSNNNQNNTVSSDNNNSSQIQNLQAELAGLKNLFKQLSPATPVRMGSLSDAMSPLQNSQAFSMMGYNSATPIYLEKFTSAEVKSWRQKMTMHNWPNPYFRYVHHTLFDYVKGQWNVFAENSMRVIPRFEDSGALSCEEWFETLEEIVSEVKLDDEGVVAPILQVSSNNGLPIMVDYFMQNLWKWLHRQERLHSKSSIRLQIVATLDRCAFAKRVIEIHNMKLAEVDPQYAPRKLVSKVNEVITSLSLAGQSVNDFVKIRNSKSNGGSGGGKGPSQSFQGANSPSRKPIPSSSNNSNGNKNVIKDKGQDKVEEEKTQVTITCHECNEKGHKRGDRICKKFDPTFDKKRKRDGSPTAQGKQNKK